MKYALVFLCFLPVTAGSLCAQIEVTGQGSAAYVKSESGFSQYVFDNGRPTFTWRFDLFADARISDNFSILTNTRILQDEVIHLDYFALRMTDITSFGLNAQAGLIDLPFGNLGDRRFPADNPFFNLPLMNEHLTSLCASDYKLWVLVPQFAIQGDGVRLLDQGLYDLGVKLYGTAGIFEYAVALTNGMISETGVYSAQGLNANRGMGKIIRLAVTPMTGLTIGVSYATGAFMDDQSNDSGSAFYKEDPTEYPQHIVMGDVDFSYGYFALYAQAAYNRWQLGRTGDYESARWRLNEDLTAFAYSVEARYAVTPRISIAARAGELLFNSISDFVPTFSGPVYYTGTWDHNTFRLETGIGYHLSREALLKLVYEWNRTYGMPVDPEDDLFVIQTVFSF